MRDYKSTRVGLLSHNKVMVSIKTLGGIHLTTGIDIICSRSPHLEGDKPVDPRCMGICWKRERI